MHDKMKRERNEYREERKRRDSALLATEVLLKNTKISHKINALRHNSRALHVLSLHVTSRESTSQSDTDTEGGLMPLSHIFA